MSIPVIIALISNKLKVLIFKLNLFKVDICYFYLVDISMKMTQIFYKIWLSRTITMWHNF